MQFLDLPFVTSSKSFWYVDEATFFENFLPLPVQAEAGNATGDLASLGNEVQGNEELNFMRLARLRHGHSGQMGTFNKLGYKSITMKMSIYAISEIKKSF